MSSLYTKNGTPLRVSGRAIFGPAGRQVGRIQGSKVYAPNGRYVATIVGDRLVYRSTDSAAVSSSYAPAAGSAPTSARVARSGIWGDEPDLE